MSMMRGGRFEHKSEGRPVAQFTKQERAQEAVRKLIDGGVTPNSISIEGTGVTTVEQVTGKLSFATAARSGAINGALFGIFFGAFVLMSTPNAPIQLPLGVLLIAIALGIVLNLGLFGVTRKRRSYASSSQIVASSYTLKVAGSEQYRKAQEILGPQTLSSDAKTQSAASSSSSTANINQEPPRYGERITPPSDVTERKDS